MNIEKEVKKKSYYNRKNKISFLLSLKDTDFTIDKKAYALQKVRKIEEKFKKEILYFDYDEIEYTMKNLEYRHIMNLNLALDTFIEYNKFMTNDKNNLFETYKKKNGKELYKYIVDLKLEKYFSEEKLNTLIDSIDVNRDKGLILALYEGIRGKHLYELRSLRVENIDEVNKKIRVIDFDQTEREVSVSSRLIELLFATNEEKSVILKDGNRTRERYFENTPYIFRSAEYLSTVRNIDLQEKMVSNHTINSIFKSIQRNFDNCEHLTPVSLVNSGIYNKILREYKRGKIQINYEGISQVLKEYKFSKSGIYSWVKRAKEIINRLENYKELEENSLKELLN